MCKRTVFEIGVHLLDDPVLPVGFIGRDGVKGAGREERVEPVRVEAGRLPGALERIQFQNPANDQAPGDAFAEPPRAERRELYFGDFCGGDPFPCGFVPDRVGVLNRRPRIISDGRDGALHGGEDVADELACPARGSGGALAESGPDDDRCGGRGGHDADQRVQSTHPGVPVTGAMLLVTVDFLDGLVNIDQGVVVDPRRDRRDLGDVDQPPPRDGIKLAEMAEGEGAQKRAQR